MSDWAKNYIESSEVKRVYGLTESLIAKISDKENCPEIIAIGEAQYFDFLSFQPNKQNVLVVMDEPKSSGNLGMVIRSAKAFGVNAIVISGHAADEYDPKCIRSSVGTFFSMPVYRVDGVVKFSQKISELRLKYDIGIIVTGDKGSASIKEMSCENEILFLILGNETRGVSKGYKEIADQFLKIPLSGEFTSLNIGAAAWIFLYEIFDKRKNLILP